MEKVTLYDTFDYENVIPTAYRSMVPHGDCCCVEVEPPHTLTIGYLSNGT